MLSPEDQEVLEQLAAAGDDRRVVRPVIHWFFGEENDLRKLAQTLSQLGWTRVDPRRDEDGWLSSPTKVTDLSEKSILTMNSEIELAVSDLEVMYDGWETSVEKSAGFLHKFWGKLNSSGSRAN